MPRTEFAAQFVLKVGRFDVETLLDIGIQLFFVGREHDGYAFVGKFVGVLLQGARVFVEILALPELQAVDEYADNNVVGAFFGFANEGEMAFVQKSRADYTLGTRTNKGRLKFGFHDENLFRRPFSVEGIKQTNVLKRGRFWL